MPDKSPNKELSVKEATDILNVSQLFLIKLLDERKIPYHEDRLKRSVILFNDLLTFKTKIDKARVETLEELIQQAQNLDMGY